MKKVVERGSRFWDYEEIADQSMPRDHALAHVLNGKDVENFETLRYMIFGTRSEPNLSSIGFITLDNKVAFKLIKEQEMDFVYDKASGLWFMDLRAHHQMLRTGLYTLYTGKGSKYVSYDAALADAYIEEGHGIFLSSMGNAIMMSEDYVLPPEFKAAFKGFKIRRL